MKIPFTWKTSFDNTPKCSTNQANANLHFDLYCHFSKRKTVLTKTKGVNQQTNNKQSKAKQKKKSKAHQTKQNQNQNQTKQNQSKPNQKKQSKKTKQTKTKIKLQTKKQTKKTKKNKAQQISHILSLPRRLSLQSPPPKPSTLP